MRIYPIFPFLCRHFPTQSYKKWKRKTTTQSVHSYKKSSVLCNFTSNCTILLFISVDISQSVCCCRRKWNWEFCLSSGGGSTSDGSMSSISRAISSNDIGMLESSSSKKELFGVVIESSVVIVLIFPMTSWDRPCAPYLSSQNIVAMRYIWVMLKTGQSSFVISSRVLCDFWCKTRNPTACLMCCNSSQDVPTYSSVVLEHHCSRSCKPAFKNSPLLKEQHSRRSSKLLKSCTFKYAHTWLNVFLIITGGT